MNGLPYEFLQNVTGHLQNDQLVQFLYLPECSWRNAAQTQTRCVFYMDVHLHEKSTIEEFELNYRRLRETKNIYRRIGKIQINHADPTVFSHVMQRIAGLGSYMNYHASIKSRLDLEASDVQVEYALNMFMQWPVYFKKLKLPFVGDLTVQFLSKQMQHGHIEVLELLGGDWSRCYSVLAQICCQPQFKDLISGFLPACFFHEIFLIWSRSPRIHDKPGNRLKMSITNQGKMNLLELIGKPGISNDIKAVYRHWSGTGIFSIQRSNRSTVWDVQISR